MVEGEQNLNPEKLRVDIEEKIERKLVAGKTFKDGRIDQAFDLAAHLVENWFNRPYINILSEFPPQNPARLILTQAKNPAFKSAQVLIRMQDCPDYITLVYYLKLTENQPEKLIAYKNQPPGDPDDGPYIPPNFKEREATFEDLEMFNKFLDEAKPLTHPSFWKSA